MNNYPPGESGAAHNLGAARFECPAHGTNYGYSWTELGGFFVDSELPRGVDEFANDNSQACPGDCQYMDAAQWETDIEAARCDQIVYQARNRHDNEIEHTIACGAWTTTLVDFVRDKRWVDEIGVVLVCDWECPHGHEFRTEEI